MTPTLASIAEAYFPLVARKRPPAKPLDARVARLVGLAEDAHRDHDPDRASMVFNGAALVASDCGEAELARTWCHQHANLYLGQAPLKGHAARFALEPVVNLARLRIRAGDGDGAHHLLTDLYQAIHDRSAATIDGLELRPEQLPTDHAERGLILAWLNDVMLADGIRALTMAGRWDDAWSHVCRYDGLGPTLHEGRQVGVIALTMRGDRENAAVLLQEATVEHPWEQVVHDLLATWHGKTTGVGLLPHLTGLLDLLLKIPFTPALSVFRTRLCLAAIDLAPDAQLPLADDAINRLVNDLLRDQDANAARDLLRHRAACQEHHARLNPLIEVSGIGMKHLPKAASESLSYALGKAATAIRRLPRGDGVSPRPQ